MTRPTPPYGYHPLRGLVGFDPDAHGFWKKNDAALRDATLRAYAARTEILGGVAGLTAGASLAADALHFDFSSSSLGQARVEGVGVLLAPDDDADIDMLTAGGEVSQPINLDGSDASGVTLGAGEKVAGALIYTNSDGSGDAVGANISHKALLVLGTPTTGDTTPITSRQIQNALDASTGVHDGWTAWMWAAAFEWTDAPALTIVPNVDNRLGV